MCSKIAISLSSADREAIAKWYVWMISIVALIVSLVFMLPIFKSPLPNSFSTTATERSPGAVCAQWDASASEAIVRVVQNTQDADLRQIDDMIIRMRRARRSCQLGWVTLACQDYRSIVRSVPLIANETAEMSWSCWPAAPA